MAIKVLGVCGSMRANSYSSRLAAIALAEARKHGAEVRLLELNGFHRSIIRPSGASLCSSPHNQRGTINTSHVSNGPTATTVALYTSISR